MIFASEVELRRFILWDELELSLLVLIFGILVAYYPYYSLYNDASFYKIPMVSVGSVFRIDGCGIDSYVIFNSYFSNFSKGFIGYDDLTFMNDDIGFYYILSYSSRSYYYFLTSSYFSTSYYFFFSFYSFIASLGSYFLD